MTLSPGESPRNLSVSDKGEEPCMKDKILYKQKCDVIYTVRPLRSKYRKCT